MDAGELDFLPGLGVEEDIAGELRAGVLDLRPLLGVAPLPAEDLRFSSPWGNEAIISSTSAAS